MFCAVSSRLALDQFGRPVAIVTTPAPRLDVGEWFLVVDPTVFGLLPARTGRPATAREQVWNRRDAPYDPQRDRRLRSVSEIPDEELDERAALEAARLEQQRRPADLIQVYAA